MTLSAFKESFQNYLTQEKNTLKSNSEVYRLESRDDEFKFAQIELNIIDIFEQMFEISIKKSATQSDWKTALQTAYLGFFEKIPTAWKQNLEKCQSHGMEEEAYLETLKLQRAALLKESFLNMLEERV